MKEGMFYGISRFVKFSMVIELKKENIAHVNNIYKEVISY